MGKIQNLTVQTLGAVAAGAAAADKAMQNAQLEEEQGLLATEQYHEASADLTSLEGESKEAGEALTKANEAVEATKG